MSAWNFPFFVNMQNKIIFVFFFCTKKSATQNKMRGTVSELYSRIEVFFLFFSMASIRYAAISLFPLPTAYSYKFFAAAGVSSPSPMNSAVSESRPVSIRCNVIFLLIRFTYFRELPASKEAGFRRRQSKDTGFEPAGSLFSCLSG